MLKSELPDWTAGRLAVDELLGRDAIAVTARPSQPATAAPFRVDVGDGVLGDLRERLGRTRFAPDFANGDWGYGVEAGYLREILDYWRDGFDWRAQECAINSFAHFRTTLQGVPVHFVHERGAGPSPLPLVLTHGWPWTFWDFHKVIRPLADPAAFGGDAADAFDVVVPSLPGFGFSSPLLTRGWNHSRTADLWVELMASLGYERFGAHGGDWGAIVSSQLGHKYADRVIGIHLTTPSTPWVWNVERPWAEVLGRVVEARSRTADRAALLEWERRRAAHIAVQTVDPQTLAYGLHDSPAALAAWLLERRRSWSDCDGDLERAFSKDELLTGLTIYWVTETFATSARYYKEAVDVPWSPAHGRTPPVEAPTGISVFRPDSPAGSTFEWLLGGLRPPLLPRARERRPLRACRAPGGRGRGYPRDVPGPALGDHATVGARRSECVGVNRRNFHLSSSSQGERERRADELERQLRDDTARAEEPAAVRRDELVLVAAEVLHPDVAIAAEPQGEEVGGAAGAAGGLLDQDVRHQVLHPRRLGGPRDDELAQGGGTRQ